MSNQSKLNRREFIKDVAIVGTGSATACVLGTLSAPAAIPEKWEKETDVLVVGYGGAGACAAIAAREAGAEVLILEKLKTGGGNTAVSGGVVYAGGTSVQKANRIADTADKLYLHFLKAGKAFINPALAKIAAEESANNIEWLIRLGAKFGVPMVSGAEIPLGSESVARVHFTGYGKLSGGAAFYKVLADTAQTREAKILFNTPVKQIIVNTTGEVMGVQADSEGKEIFVKARKAVVLAAGGFSRNKEMLAAYSRDGYYSPSLGAIGLTGDGIRMALALGADVSNMSKVVVDYGLVLPGAERATYAGEGGIVINILAKRFVDETSFYDRKGIILLQQPESRAFSIFDEAYRKSRKSSIVAGFSNQLEKEVAARIVRKANTIAALGLSINVPPDTLEQTIKKCTQDVKSGVDSDYGRKTLLEPISTPPFYAYETLPVMFDTSGGVKVNTRSQVINVSGKVIPRLYAAGVNMGGLVGEFYPGSGSVLNGILTFGRIAGRNASLEKPWDASK